MEMALHQQRRGTLGRNNSLRVPLPIPPSAQRHFPQIFQPPFQRLRLYQGRRESPPLFLPPSLSSMSWGRKQQGHQASGLDAQRPHGERSALEKFLKSKGSGLGCHTRPSLCAHIVCPIKGAGPGKREPVSRRLGRLLGNARALPFPRHQAPRPGLRGGGAGVPGWRSEPRSPVSLQVALPGLWEAVEEATRK